MVAHAGALAAYRGANLVVLAFPGGKGTASCIREPRRWHRLRDRRVALEVVELSDQPAQQASLLSIARAGPGAEVSMLTSP